MAMMVSIHHYTLRAGVSDRQFEACVAAAKERGLLNLPGLVGYYFLKGIKGSRKAGYSAVWLYESREAWEKLWGSADHPYEKNNYPRNWIAWEDEILAAVLGDDPDRIEFTSYECFSSVGFCLGAGAGSGQRVDHQVERP